MTYGWLLSFGQSLIFNNLGGEDLQASPPQHSSDSFTHDDKGVYTLKAAFNSQYRTLNKRLESFITWPPGLKQQGLDMALAGFYYTGQSDSVLCFYCGIGLGVWMPNDVPISEHLIHSPCAFAKLHKTIPHSADQDKKGMNQHNNCGICDSAPKNIILIPCRHLYTCTLCTFSVENCPLCRSNITKIMQIYTN